MAGLRKSFTGGSMDLDSPYLDVRAAWRWYLDHDNQGRGVILIGHSQGAILLQRLIAEEIDGKPVQGRLVSALLAGDPALPIPSGATTGGVFKHVPVCSSAGQTGCTYAWASYVAGDPQPRRIFGANPGGGLVAACVNPAAVSGGKGGLKAYVHKPAMAPAGDPPWIEIVGQLSAACVTDGQGAVLSISVDPSRFAGLLQAMLQMTSSLPGWGLHLLDLNLTQGNILDLMDAEIETWTKR